MIAIAHDGEVMGSTSDVNSGMGHWEVIFNTKARIRGFTGDKREFLCIIKKPAFTPPPNR